MHVNITELTEVWWICLICQIDQKMEVQSDLGYPATLGPAHIRISDLAGYERYALTQHVQ